ncbi:MAG: hydrogen gas-evolving membrane-bound hydrogenase subunit E [Haloferacaceae archaeon]
MQSTLAVVLAIVFLPFAAAAVTPLVARALGERTAYFAASVAAVAFALVAALHLGGAHGTVAVPWVPSLGVALAFHVDGLALLIAFLASGVGVLVFVYSGGYMHGEPGLTKYYATMLAFMGSMLGVALAGDLVALFVFWELTSLSSFLLIGHYSGADDSTYAARKSMLVTVSGGLFMLVGFVLLAWASGRAGATTYLIPELVARAPAVRAALREVGLFVPVLLLLGVGAATKSAQVPFHIWLPNAMEAPTPVSAFLHSATMVKAGVYLVGRFRPFFLPAGEGAPPLGEWTLVFASLGLLTMTATAVLAVHATDIKELLAYSTASHLGLIVAGFGFAGAVGAETGAFHILNHASFKAALFLVAGVVAHEAGTRRIDRLGGLRRDLPVTAAVATVASLSMAGVPPFNGFYSKEFLFDAAYETAHAVGGLAWAFPVVAVLGSVFTFLYSVRFLMLFWGDRPAGLGEVHRPPLAMLAPAVVLGALVVAVSAAPQVAVDAVVGAAYAAAVPGEAHGFAVHLPTSLSPPVAMSATTIALGLVAYPTYDRLHRGLRRALRGPVAANWWYDTAVDGLPMLSRRATPAVQTGLLRTYATWTFAATATLALGGYVAAGVSVPLPASLGPGVTLAMALVALVAVLAAAAVVASPSHVAGVLTLSILGFMVAVLYVLADAPDLALTQLVVETLVLVIFLLVLHRLPAFYGDLGRGRAARDGLLALAVGATVSVTVLLATAARPNDALATFLVERAGLPDEHGHLLLDWGGGGNVVNVILVDFRGFDTLGEISVVAMAALAVLTLIRMRDRGETP